MDYYTKYLKYKSKYINLKKTLGGTNTKHAIYGGRFVGFDLNKILILHKNYDLVLLCVFVKDNDKMFNAIDKFINENKLGDKIYLAKSMSNPIYDSITYYISNIYPKHSNPQELLVLNPPVELSPPGKIG